MELQKTANDLASERTDLAIMRTVMAADRSLMAWNRTGLSMLSFGFTLYKFLLYVQQDISKAVLHSQGPRHLGVFLIGLGTACMVSGLIEYYNRLKKLGKESPVKPWSYTFFVGIAASLLGLFLLGTILVNRELF
jgi:putative membrane protein